MIILLKKYTFLFAWVVSVIATCGSLFFSEIMHFEPFKLCWLQRICMYPLTVILGYATFKEDRKYAQTAYPLSIVGFGVVLYHYFGQKIASIGKLLPCSVYSSEVTTYSGSVSARTSYVIVTPIVMNDSTVTVNGKSVVSGGNQLVSINVGTTTKRPLAQASGLLIISFVILKFY
ncbi:disulfide bond formation protein B [Paenibacillus sp. OSY-SE]|uniref:disulfide bond formation protein B n=1 Tax=Paenibacillus sp. OSY-SE TaxID=1196323 RepID=UPI000363DC00